MACGPTKLGGLLCAVLMMSSSAVAQYVPYVGGVRVVPYYGRYGYGRYGGYGGYGYGNWGAGSTAAGSYLSGLGQVIRAEGQYNLNTSAAAINLAEARKREIENQKQWTNTYFEMRRINESYRHPKRPPVPADTWARLAHDAAPARLPNHMLDAVNGQIVWPSALQGDEFAPEREALEQSFAERAASHGAIGIEGHAAIRKAVDAALAKLKTHIRRIDSGTYLEARKFLNSLGYEASFASAG